MCIRDSASIEVDVFFAKDPDLAKTDGVDGHLGEGSHFHETFGCYAQGCDVTTATLPDGWQDRLVPFAPPVAQGATGWCLEPHDLAVSKLFAGRDKDREFVAALLDGGLIDVGVLRSRALVLPGIQLQIRRVLDWLDAYTVSRAGR